MAGVGGQLSFQIEESTEAEEEEERVMRYRYG